MKIASTPKSKRALIMSVAGVVVIAAAAWGAYKYLGPSSHDQTQTTTSPQAAESTADGVAPASGNDQKQSYINRAKSDNNSSASTTSDKQAASVLLTHKGQNGTTLQLRVLISAVTSGKCELTMTKTGEATISREVDIQPMADSSTCKGFDVDTTNMASGSWNFTIKINSDAYSGSVKDTVTIR